MNEVRIPHYQKYEVRLTAWQAFKALVTAKPLRLPASQVKCLVEFGVGTSRVNIECWGAGGGGGSETPGWNGGEWAPPCE